MTLKQRILVLRKNKKSYAEISKIVGCSKGNIAYHCSSDVKNKQHARQNKSRNYYMITIKNDRGGKCTKCGYDKCLQALEFHHTDPSTKYKHNGKAISIRQMVNLKTRKEVLEETKKCILLCSNCHKELHYL
jgi:hypothetical protein